MALATQVTGTMLVPAVAWAGCSLFDPPETTITSGPSGFVSSTSATFYFTSDCSTASFSCSLDGGTYASCPSPKSYTGLSQGSHTFKVYAYYSRALDGTPAARTWTVDTVKPDTTITSAPPSPTKNSTLTYQFTSNEKALRFECSFNGSGYSTCTSPHSIGPVADGRHTFNVRAVDLAGNIDASPATNAVTVDTSAPDTTITSEPESPTTSTTLAFEFTSNESVLRFECNLDGGTYSICTSPHSLIVTAGAEHTFGVRAVDLASNVDPSPALSSTKVVSSSNGCN